MFINDINFSTDITVIQYIVILFHKCKSDDAISPNELSSSIGNLFSQFEYEMWTARDATSHHAFHRAKSQYE